MLGNKVVARNEAYLRSAVLVHWHLLAWLENLRSRESGVLLAHFYLSQMALLEMVAFCAESFIGYRLVDVEVVLLTRCLRCATFDVDCGMEMARRILCSRNEESGS
jgi:hypothetical protein